MTISEAARKDIRASAAKLEAWKKIPTDQFPGHKSIACANLEGWLGRYTVPLLDALEETEKKLEVK